jgi:hypothetical protein
MALQLGVQHGMELETLPSSRVNWVARYVAGLTYILQQTICVFKMA